MAIKLDCPRCKTHLQVPDGLVGGYVNCPRCQGRVWAAKQSAVVPPTPAGASAPAGPRQPLEPTNPPAHSMAPIAPAPPTVPPKKIARFITADAADSTLRLAADGKLPDLRLEEGATEQKQKSEGRSINPLILFGALGVSMVLSIVLALTDMGSPPISDAARKAQARQKIEDEYFGSGTLDAKQLEPYQVLLREAHQAYSRGDYKSQRENYRRVLNMLRAERGSEEKGLTGSRSKDRTLEEDLLILLSGG